MSFDLAVVGAGNWGTTLAVVQARDGRRVLLCTRDEGHAAALRQARENSRALPGVAFPDGLQVAGSYAAAAAAPLVLLAVPSEHLRPACRALAGALAGPHRLVSATKGLEEGTALRVSQVIAQELPALASDVCVLSGPNLAGEIARGKPAASVLACMRHNTATAVAPLLATPVFRLYTSDDLIGVELGGALKNVIALAAGICDGLEMGINGKAAIVTRGMAEMVRLGRAAGADPLTFAGLSGYGDLFATCTSPSSRNHYVGERLGQGVPLAEVLAGMTMVAEGVHTVRPALALAARHGVELPIAEQVEQVLFADKEPRTALADLLSRSARDERTGEIV